MCTKAVCLTHVCVCCVIACNAEALASMRRLEEYLLLDEQQPQPQSKNVEVNFVSGSEGGGGVGGLSFRRESTERGRSSEELRAGFNSLCARWG